MEEKVGFILLQNQSTFFRRIGINIFRINAFSSLSWQFNGQYNPTKSQLVLKYYDTWLFSLYFLKSTVKIWWLQNPHTFIIFERTNECLKLEFKNLKMEKLSFATICILKARFLLILPLLVKKFFHAFFFLREAVRLAKVAVQWYQTDLVAGLHSVCALEILIHLKTSFGTTGTNAK